jgi:hypothetical protein
MEQYRNQTDSAIINDLEEFSKANGGPRIKTRCTCKIVYVIQMRDAFFNWYDNDLLTRNTNAN